MVFRCHYGSSALHWYANSASSTINDVVTPGANLSRLFVAGIESSTHAAAFHGICGFAIRPDKLLRLNRRASCKNDKNGGNEHIFETANAYQSPFTRNVEWSSCEGCAAQRASSAASESARSAL
jgi:hypothetical protein